MSGRDSQQLDHVSGDQDRYWKGTYEPPAQDESQTYYAPVQTEDPDKRARKNAAEQAFVRKDHAAAGLFAIFLGLFGIHKFYLGYNQAGFIMLAATVIGSLVSFGFAALVVEVIAVVEGIIYLSKSQTEFDRIYVANRRDWF